MRIILCPSFHEPSEDALSRTKPGGCPLLATFHSRRGRSRAVAASRGIQGTAADRTVTMQGESRSLQEGARPCPRRRPFAISFGGSPPEKKKLPHTCSPATRRPPP